jgi:hypothetical protein
MNLERAVNRRLAEISADDSAGCRVVSLHPEGAREIAYIPLTFRPKSALICGL